MDNDMLLAKQQVPAGWVDMGIGEALVVRQALFGTIRSLQGWVPPRSTSFQYQNPQGSLQLLEALKNITPHPCVVTQGAKIAILTCLLAARRRGYTTVMSQTPYWTSFPSIAELAGMKFQGFSGDFSFHGPTTVMIITSPNNPDGRTADTNMALFMKQQGCFVIHDAVYDTEAYGAGRPPLIPCDVRIRSASKMFGLSGIRLGWIEVLDESIKKDLIDIVETTTSGVATHSQALMADIINVLTEQNQWDSFNQKAHEALEINRKLFLDAIAYNVTHESLEAARCASGMFAWLQGTETLDTQKARVRIVSGENFGVAGWFRANLGGDPQECLKAGLRLGGNGAV